jgi:hypothetical protein
MQHACLPPTQVWLEGMLPDPITPKYPWCSVQPTPTRFEPNWRPGPATAWVDVTNSVVTIHLDMCSVLGEGVVKGNRVIVQGQGYKGEGKVMTEGRSRCRSVWHHVLGSMHWHDLDRQPQHCAWFEIVIHRQEEVVVGPQPCRTEMWWLEIDVQKWTAEGGADVTWVAAA